MERAYFDYAILSVYGNWFTKVHIGPQDVLSAPKTHGTNGTQEFAPEKMIAAVKKGARCRGNWLSMGLLLTNLKILSR